MQINSKNSHKKKYVIIAALLLLAVAAGAAWFYASRQDAPVDTSTQEKHSVSNEANKENRVYESESEGQSVTVPDNVSPDSIKNYTLVTENEAYKIRELNGEYTITLYAIINRPEQADMYRDQLREYKRQALQYLSEHNVDVNKVKITYEPTEAADL